MTESIGLFYFSGTGNTQVVTELLAAALKQRSAQVETARIEHVLQGKAQFDPEVYDSVGPDGLAGGSPHLHTVCTEAYLVIAGEGMVRIETVVFEYVAVLLQNSLGCQGEILKRVCVVAFEVPGPLVLDFELRLE